MITKFLGPFLFYSFVFLLLLQVITDTDFGWHLAVGKFIFENQSVPKQDLFSFTLPNYQYIYHSWATYLSIFLSYKFFGLTGVTIFYSIILTISIYFLVKTSEILYPKSLNLFIFFAATPLIQSIAGARPRALSFLFFTVVYYLFLKFVYQKSKIIYFTPVVFLLWVNFHGSFLVGLATFACLILTSVFLKDTDPPKLKTLLKILFSSAAATLVNPYFIDAWKQALTISFNSSLKLSKINIDWKPLISPETNGWIFASLAIVTIIALYKLKIKVSMREKILLLTFFLFSLYTARFSLPFLVFFIPAVHILIEEGRKKISQKIINLAPVKIAVYSLFATIMLFALSNVLQLIVAYASFENYSYFLQEKAPNKHFYASWPYQSSKFVAEKYKDKNILVDANWSGYLLLQDPNLKVFYYGAMDNYVYQNKSFANEYLNLINAKSPPESTLEKYKVDVVFLPPIYPITNSLKSNSLWKIIKEDKKSIIFEKINP